MNWIKRKAKEIVYGSKVKKAIGATEEIYQIVKNIDDNKEHIGSNIDEIFELAIKRYNDCNSIDIPQEAYPLVKDMIFKIINKEDTSKVKSQLAGMFFNLAITLGKHLLMYIIQKKLSFTFKF